MRRALICLLTFTTLVGAAPVQVREVQSIAAVVNDEVISVLDLEERLKLAIASSNLEDTAETRRRLLPLVLRSLIDERLQLQEAERLNIKVSDSEIAEALARIEKQNNLSEGGLDAFLAEQGIERDTMVQQLRASIAWGKVIKRRIRPTIDIGEDEVEDALAHLETVKNKPQDLVAEIFLSVDSPEQETEVRQTAERLVAQIRRGASFPALARQFSQSGTAVAGGDIGWVTEGEFDEELEAALAQMTPPAISAPIRTVTGYNILFLRDRRTPGAAGSEGTRVRLVQIYLPLPRDASEEAVAKQREAAEAIRQEVKTCGDMVRLSAELKSPLSGDLGWLKVEDLPEHLRKVVGALKVGAVSKPVQTQDAVSILMVCERKDPKTELPDREKLAESLLLERLDMMARRYLRDLRRFATLDVRI